ncbi:cytochrome c3 family protein [Telmatobacter bradus]|uniref:cytochrome c3 family protein n=1 Tax=Telmatobacter bradus TaxID=474953 RepID=UPI003B42ED02
MEATLESILRMKTFFQLLAFSLCFATILVAQDKPGATQDAQGKPYTSQLHIKAGLGCEACHGTGKKAPVEADKCLECHESFKAVSERTQDMKPNPHANHLVKMNSVECTDCHHGHKTNEVVCKTCHQDFDFSRHK